MLHNKNRSLRRLIFLNRRLAAAKLRLDAPFAVGAPGRRSLLVSLLVALLFSVVALGLPSTGSATTSPNLGPCIYAGQYIRAGQYLTVYPNWYKLIMQPDGNLVLYTSSGQPLWDSETDRHPGAYAVLQGDGNLVVYPSTGTVPLWSAYVPSLPQLHDRLCVQSDANLVVYSSSNSPLWATMTYIAAPVGSYWPYPTNPASDNGQCTWWAEEEFHRYTGRYIDTTATSGTTGDAMYWATNAQRRGWSVGSTARIDSIAVFPYGHVAWVIEVYPSQNKIRISEMNCYKCGDGGTGGYKVTDERTISAAGLQYIYVNP